MSSIRTQQRVERVNGVFLRAIGRLSLADYELRALRAGGDVVAGSGAEAWAEFADHLESACDAIKEAASGSVFAGNTIAVMRQGVRVPVGVEYIDRMSDKVERHVRVGRAFGIADPVVEGVAISA